MDEEWGGSLGRLPTPIPDFGHMGRSPGCLAPQGEDDGREGGGASYEVGGVGWGGKRAVGPKSQE